jgi:hypothetical protein
MDVGASHSFVAALSIALFPSLVLAVPNARDAPPDDPLREESAAEREAGDPLREEPGPAPEAADEGPPGDPRPSAGWSSSGSTKSTAPSTAPRTVDTVLQEYFTNVDCGVSPKIKKKLARKGVSLVPQSATKEFQSIARLPVEWMRGRNIRVVLHRVSVGKQTLTVTGAYSYEVFDPFAYIDNGQDNFVYSLDCSGYFNSALSAGVPLPGGAVQASASAAAASSKTFNLVHAVVYSPLSAAVDPGNAPTLAASARMSRRERIDILWGIHATVVAGVDALTDSTKISMWRQVELIGTTRQGSSSLQGRMDVSASGGAATVSSSGGAGVAVSRKISFSTFDTYFVEEKTKATDITLKDLRRKITQEVAKAKVRKKLSVQNENVVTWVDLPRKICELDWQAEDVANAYSLDVHYDGASDVCAFTIQAPDVTAAASVKSMTVKVPNAMGDQHDLRLAVR